MLHVKFHKYLLINYVKLSKTGCTRDTMESNTYALCELMPFRLVKCCPFNQYMSPHLVRLKGPATTRYWPSDGVTRCVGIRSRQPLCVRDLSAW